MTVEDRRSAAWARRTAGALLALTAAWPAPAPAAAPSAACASDVPLVLNVGIPLEAELPPSALERAVEERFAHLPAALRECPGQRSLQVNLAIGTDYQILDWLGRGAIDAAVVPELARHLLQRDQVELSEDALGSGEHDALTPPVRLALRSFDVDGDAWSERPDPWFDLAGFQQWLWRGVEAGGGVRPLHLTAEEVRREPQLCEQMFPRREQPAYRLSLASHLSSAGFLQPVAMTHRWLERALAGTPPARREVYRECYWRSFFHHTCFRIPGGDPVESGCATAPLFAARRIELRAERAAVGAGGSAVPSPAPAVRDRLVIRRERAEDLFRAGTFPPASPAPSPGPGVAELLAVLARPEHEVPGAFRSLALPEPYFGVRTFSFTIDESLRLLRAHQESSGRPRMALILPGGGVKAAYQSRIIDRLYQRGDLRNYRAVPENQDGASGARRPLLVEYVIGTSGGALLGYFVSRLGDQGPYQLADVLWMRPIEGDSGRLTPLTNADIFPFTDLLRYVSLLAILIVFGGVLAAFSVPPNAPFSPDRALPGQPAPGATGAVHTVRWRLLAVLAAALGLAPVLVRELSGDHSIEHVPEIEGLIFAVLVTLVIFADQCLVYRRPGAPPPETLSGPLPPPGGQHRLWVPPPALLGLGLALALGPTAIAWTPLAAWLSTPIVFRDAYLFLAAPLVALLLIVVRRPHGAARVALEVAAWAAGFAIASGLALWVLRSISQPRLEKLDQNPPLLFLALLATPVLFGLSRLARRHRQVSGLLGRVRGPAWLPPVLRALALPAAILFVCFLIMELCRPEAAGLAEGTTLAALAQPSKLDTPAGALLVMLGVLLVVVGWILHLWERVPGYDLVHVRPFVNGMLFVAGGVAGGVYLVLLVGSRVAPGRLTLFELDGEFWLPLVLLSGVLSLAVVVWALAGGARRRSSAWLAGALRYLCSRHPNAFLVTRRFARVGLIAVVGLVWWNFVVAPGLYGNRQARHYFDEAQGRFLSTTADGGRLTARLLAPANALRERETRFLLVTPDESDCPSIRRTPGVTWYRFRMAAEAEGRFGLVPCAGGGREPQPLAMLDAFIFASGSPFPVFPAHLVPLPGAESKVPLVDGGYSNNTPVQAAELVDADQVLIVHSSNPLPPAGASTRFLDRLQGPLVADVLRLPGFLYERSQQGDRHSREGAFVVSMAPVWRADWPFLADFGRETVRAMRQAATEDLPRRIGIVESWGPPQFQLSARVDPAARR